MCQNGYQISGLIQALTALQNCLKGFEFSLDWTGESEATVEHGNVPTVKYMLDIQGRRVVAKHPLPVVIAPATIAQSIQAALGAKDETLQSLIENIANAPVT